MRDSGRNILFFPWWDFIPKQDPAGALNYHDLVCSYGLPVAGQLQHVAKGACGTEPSCRPADLFFFFFLWPIFWILCTPLCHIFFWTFKTQICDLLAPLLFVTLKSWHNVMSKKSWLGILQKKNKPQTKTTPLWYDQSHNSNYGLDSIWSLF